MQFLLVKSSGSTVPAWISQKQACPLLLKECALLHSLLRSSLTAPKAAREVRHDCLRQLRGTQLLQTPFQRTPRGSRSHTTSHAPHPTPVLRHASADTRCCGQLLHRDSVRSPASWGAQMNALLAPAGALVITLVWPLGPPAHSGGPPHSVTVQAYAAALGGAFAIVYD